MTSEGNSLAHGAKTLLCKASAAIPRCSKTKEKESTNACRRRSTDEVMGVLRKQEEEKRMKKKGTEKKVPRRDKGKHLQKAQPRKEPQTTQLPESSEEDTDHCFTCGDVCIDTEVREWVGCDSCYRWYHFKCAGLKRLPKKAEQFVCHICQN